MKDKLYKLHRGHKYYIFRRIFVGAALLISSSILVAISLSISLSMMKSNLYNPQVKNQPIMILLKIISKILSY